MIRLLLGTSLVIAFALGSGCKRDSVEETGASANRNSLHDDRAHEGGTHEGHDHGDGDGHDHAEQAKDDGHGHDEEVALGSAMIGDMKVEFAQGHGKVEAGKEGHLVVKLPYNDKGDTVVRGWIGMEDRTLSFVGKGAYAASHDDYDVHAIAPDPLPENVMWWIELAKPDGTKAVGSIKPLLE